MRKVLCRLPGGQIGTVSSTARHRCDVFSKVCYPGAKPRRWTPLLVAHFSVIIAFHNHKVTLICALPSFTSEFSYDFFNLIAACQIPPTTDSLIIMKHLIQGRYNVTRLRVEPLNCDHGRRKTDAPNHCATLPIIMLKRVWLFQKAYAPAQWFSKLFRVITPLSYSAYHHRPPLQHFNMTRSSNKFISRRLIIAGSVKR